VLDNNKLLVQVLLYVRPLLEFNSVVWSPYLKRDFEILEKVHRRLTKRLRGFRELSYKERLMELNLQSPEWRRLYI